MRTSSFAGLALVLAGCGIDAPSGPGDTAPRRVTSAAAEVVAPTVVVSFTFDDTLYDQYTNAAPALEARGMRGTFYVNASRLAYGPAYGLMTEADVLELQARGHEIGSHGLRHDHLTTALSLRDQIRRELCDSRVDLAARGLTIRSFAWPYGDQDAFAQATAQECGYSTARGVGSSSGTIGLCSTCAHSETLPPGNAFNVSAPPSWGNSKTLATAKAYVDAAGLYAPAGSTVWLIMNFHHVCPGATCDASNAWDTATFESLLDYVATKPGYAVRTVSDVWGGEVRPLVASGTPLVLNGDLESYLSGNGKGPSPTLPDCWYWMRTSTAAHDRALSQVAGRSGLAQQVVLSNYVGGGEVLLQNYNSGTWDLKSCTTPVVPGHTFAFSCWYRSDVPVAFKGYQRGENTVWASFPSSASTAASPAAWSRATWNVTIPAGVTSLAFGLWAGSVCTSGCLNGSGTGTMIVDDCSATDTTPEPPAPTFSVGGTVSGLAGGGLVLRNGVDALAISANGPFTFPTPVPDGGTYAVTVGAQPTSPGQTCTVTRGAGTLAGAAITDVAVVCATSAYPVGGTVSGLAGGGLVLRNGVDALAISANGPFTFPASVPDGGEYAVTVGTQPTSPWQTCTVTNGAGTMAGAAVTDVAVVCATNAYRIGGTVSGLTGAGLVLQQSGGDDLAIAANGTFSFATPVPSGGVYSVAVTAQPGNPAQACSVSRGSGTVGGADVADVSVTCRKKKR